MSLRQYCHSVNNFRHNSKKTYLFFTMLSNFYKKQHENWAVFFQKKHARPGHFKNPKLLNSGLATPLQSEVKFASQAFVPECFWRLVSCFVLYLQTISSGAPVTVISGCRFPEQSAGCAQFRSDLLIFTAILSLAKLRCLPAETL